LGILIDIHLHTARHSECSRIDASKLIERAVRAGLHGIIITEHHYQWDLDELDELSNAAKEPGFLLLSGFEYTSLQGDILVYGLDAAQCERFAPMEDAREVVPAFQADGGLCVAAHPTRAGLSFDDTIGEIGFDALEARSVNLQSHEQRLATRLTEMLGLPALAASDAHQLEDVGAYALSFDAPIQSMAEFLGAVRAGRCTPVTQRA